jgi:polysaccharide chain length determinant protein (PEP-CTERM system associated)
MIENRELTMEDYLAMLRRRLKVILIPALLAPLAGFLISYAFSPKYTSQSLVLVQGQKVPDAYVQPVITSDFTQRIATLQQQVLSSSQLKQMLEGMGITKADEQNALISDMQAGGVQVQGVMTSMSAAASAGLAAKRNRSGANSDAVPGFTVSYTDSDSRRAQQICGSITSLILTQNSKNRAETVKDTTDFLSRQVDDAKRALDEQDARLADFKKKYMGQLPGDADNNVRILMTLNSQLDASTQTLSRAQQDKAYTESMLAQQLAAWKSSQSSTNPQTLEQQLSTLQSQLLQLQARYTNDHPDVIKTKADIAEVQKKLNQLNTAAVGATSTKDKSDVAEPPEIRQLRLQVHQYEGVISQASTEQKRLQGQIQLYQSRAAMSPAIEEQYKVLTRDYDNAQSFYQDLLKKKSSSELAYDMENQAQGEQMTILNPASLPDSPSFPNRLVFAGAGLGAGLALGLFLAIVLELGDKSIRTEKDAAAVMDLPLLASVPWLGEEENAGIDGGRHSLWRRNGSQTKDREKVEV